MKLIQIDVVGLQPLQTLLYRQQDALARIVQFFTDVTHVAVGSGDFGRNHELIALSCFFEPIPDERFCAAVSGLARRNRVHFCGVYKVDALLGGVIELLVCVGFCILLAKSHRPETDSTDFDVGIGKCGVVHYSRKLESRKSKVESRK